MRKVLISLYDLTGNASRPYERAGWKVYRIDIQAGVDILEWDYNIPIKESDHSLPEVGIIAMQPCTCYAISGNRHKAKRLITGEFDASQRLVARTKEIIDYYDSLRLLIFWQLENPMTDIHKKNPWIGPVRHKFNPCDYAGYLDNPEQEAYNKQTWLFGKFNVPVKKRVEPIEKDSPIWKNFGGRSIETKNARSVTPNGFAQAFFEVNN